VWPSKSKNTKMTPGELYVLLPRGLKIDLSQWWDFWTINFEKLQLIEIIYITYKYNQYVICFPFILLYSFLCVTFKYTQLSPHTLKIGHMFLWTYLVGIVHTTTS
jgi:hypothetical protein